MLTEADAAGMTSLLFLGVSGVYQGTTHACPGECTGSFLNGWMRTLTQLTCLIWDVWGGTIPLIDGPSELLPVPHILSGLDCLTGLKRQAAFANLCKWASNSMLSECATALQRQVGILWNADRSELRRL